MHKLQTVAVYKSLNRNKRKVQNKIISLTNKKYTLKRKHIKRKFSKGLYANSNNLKAYIQSKPTLQPYLFYFKFKPKKRQSGRNPLPLASITKNNYINASILANNKNVFLGYSKGFRNTVIWERNGGKIRIVKYKKTWAELFDDKDFHKTLSDFFIKNYIKDHNYFLKSYAEKYNFNYIE